MAAANGDQEKSITSGMDLLGSRTMNHIAGMPDFVCASPAQLFRLGML
jgi:hypothetical protein